MHTLMHLILDDLIPAAFSDVCSSEPGIFDLAEVRSGGPARIIFGNGKIASENE